jgi:hypothetical protein
MKGRARLDVQAGDAKVPWMRACVAALLALGVLGGAGGRAHALADDAPAPLLPPPPADTGHGIDVSFGGGALVPNGPMTDSADAGLDVGGRLGWSSHAGLGLVFSLDYAPLRLKTPAGVDESVDAHLFAGSLAPRLMIGRSLLRVWLAPSAGVLVERTQVQPQSGNATSTVDSGLTVGGQGGLDFLFFESGGLSFAGGYTHGLSSVEKYRYLAFTAGILFTL